MLLRSQIQQQKKEVMSLEEKLNHSEIAIAREQESYNTLKNGTKLLHLELLHLTGEKNSLMCKVNDLEKLKQSFTYAKQELHHERYKNSALERAMQQPLNVHRWRLLKALSFEINMNETYMSSYQAEISRLKEEVKKMKLKQFFREKRKIVPAV
ncbi:unnamed protein product [Larinioides sclopetarius]|uniref:Uncharacterized protein n=1 Tax=Larinioides sclopetarius TaxID=280406 RepID=A0AAV1Z429_9ARAC